MAAIWEASVLAALLLGAPAPSGEPVQPSDSTRFAPAGPETVFGPAFWEEIRELAERNDARERRIARYAERYRIAPELAERIIASARAEGIDPDLAFRLVRVESRFQPRARGPRGALGLTQLMPSTARAVNPALRTEAAILDPDNNLRVGFRYLRMMIDKFGGDVRLGLLAYNRGEGTVARALRQGRDPSNGYARKVLGRDGSNTYRGEGTVGRD